MQRDAGCDPGQGEGAISPGWLLDVISYYLIPLAVVVLTVLALGADRGGPAGRDAPLSFQAREAPPGEDWEPAQARQALAQAPRVSQLNTQLSERPLWLLVTPQGQDWSGRFVDFPSRHAQAMTCWDAATLAEIGAADRSRASGGMAAFRAGFAVRDAASHSAGGLLCRAEYAGPARVGAAARPHAEFAALSQAFVRSAALFEGGFITLALFTLLAAIVNRESRYVLLAVWMIGSLRVGGMSMGWDTQWLGRPVPPEWLWFVRQLTIAAYYILTYTLFCQVFRNELGRQDSRAVRVGRGLGLPLLALAAVLPASSFLPAMWAMVSLGAVIIVVFLVRCVMRGGSRAAIWYILALAMMLAGALSEVIAAAFDFNALIGWFNSVTGAMAASLVAAYAFADQVRAERADRVRAQDELQRTYDVTPVGLFTLDEEGVFLRVNRAMSRMAGLAPGQAGVGGGWDACFGRGEFARLQGLADSADGGEAEIRAAGVPPDGPVWFLVRVARAGSRIEGSLQNVTERRRLTERLRLLADNDFLTGVYNRRGIEARLERAIAAVGRGTSGPLALAYLDLDRFKLVNDLYGHQIGDEVLKQATRRVGAIAREGHSLGRVGGDEFIVVMPGTSMRDARAQCQRIIEAIGDSLFHVRAHAFWVRVSVGLVEITDDISVKDAVAAVDRACREAKTGRSGRLVVYERDAAVFRERAEELRLVEEMAESFLPKGLFLAMQPIMSLRDPEGSLNFEVLLRMRAEDGRMIPAERVVAAAETNGTVTKLDHWVLTNALEWMQANRSRLDRTRFVCVNLSGASLNDEAFMADVYATLEQYRDVAGLLCLEITEGVAVHDVQNGRRFIERLRQFGARVALDDFGAGYTSFLYLKELPADALKIDGSFIRTLHQHSANVAILESIVQLARNLGMSSIAEWVEDEDTLKTLSRLGVDYVQGFLVAPPMAPETLLAGRSAADFVADPALAALIGELAGARNPLP